MGNSNIVSMSTKLHYYEFPYAPQQFEVQPQPRISKLLTIGGVVIQLLGCSLQIDFAGLLTTPDTYTKFQRTAQNGLFLKFAKWATEAQQSGEAVGLTYAKRNINVSGSITGFDYEQDLKTVSYSYKIQMQVDDYFTDTSSSSYNSLFDKLKNEIGFSDPGGGWHGGTSSNMGTWTKIKAITGLDITTISPQKTPSSSSTPLGGMTQNQAKAYAHSLLTQYGLSPSQWTSLVWLWNRESTWTWTDQNSNSSAYGIAQRMLGDFPVGSAESYGISEEEYKNSAAAQIRWGLQYIRGRYGSIAGAVAHEHEYGWY